MASESVIDPKVAWKRTRLPSIWPLRASWAQQRRLLRLIATTAEQRVNLLPALAAWAMDERGRYRNRLFRLVYLLERGEQLPDALESIPNILSEEALLAVRLGSQSGNLARSVRDVLSQSDEAEIGLSKRGASLGIYFWLVAYIGLAVAIFFQLKIFPELRKIYNEFEISPSEPFLLADRIDASVLLAGLGLILLFWLLLASWPGRLLRRSVLGRLSGSLRKLRVADLLDRLSTAAESGRPLAGAISTLARYHFDPRIRNKLLFVRNELEQGSQLWSSMREVRLIDERELEVMQAAQHETLPWMLKQLAQQRRGRTLSRVAYWQQLMTPLFVLLLGSFVLLQALALFTMLTNLVTSLT